MKRKENQGLNLGGCHHSIYEKRKRTLRKSLRISGQRSRGNQTNIQEGCGHSVKCYRERKKETFK